MIRKTRFLKTAVAAALSLAAGAALADLTVGVVVPMTGPASGLGIPANNALKLWPQTIAGEKVRLIVLDDATDPTRGVEGTRRLVSEDKVDVIVGSVATPVAIPMAGVAFESGTPQLLLSPAVLPPGKDAWSFRMPQDNAVMAHAIIEHMKKLRVKTVGFLGYTDAYGESWLRDFQDQSKLLNGPKIVATERFARSDTSVTAQALKLAAANPDAMLVVASGSGAAMPEMAIVERGYKGRIYQTHAAATRDLMRIGGKEVEGTYVVCGPAVVADQLPASNPSRAAGLDFIGRYEALYGKGSRNQFAAHAYDAELVLEKAVPVALKKARPGTREFRAALRDAIENMGRTVVSQGVLTYTKDNHWGYSAETGVIMKVVNGDWKVE